MIKQKKIVELNLATENLTYEQIGEIIGDTSSNDIIINLPAPLNGAWYRIININTGIITVKYNSSNLVILERNSEGLFLPDSSETTWHFGKGAPASTQVGSIIEVTDSIILALTDINNKLKVTSASNITITIPPYLTVGFEINDEIEIIQYGTGSVTFVQDTGVTIRSKDGLLVIDGQYSSVALTKIATNEWLLIGALTS